MICTCEDCRFVFESMALLGMCPDCGRGPVREATPAEKAEYAVNRRRYGPMQVYGAPPMRRYPGRREGAK